MQSTIVGEIFVPVNCCYDINSAIFIPQQTHMHSVINSAFIMTYKKIASLREFTRIADCSRLGEARKFLIWMVVAYRILVTVLSPEMDLAGLGKWIQITCMMYEVHI